MGFVFKPDGRKAAGLDQSWPPPPLVHISRWHTFEQSARSSNPRRSFQMYTNCWAMPIQEKCPASFITAPVLKKKSFTFIFPWSGRSFNFGIWTQTLAGLGLLTAGATGSRLWLIILLSMGYNNGKLTSGTQHLYSVTFQVWLTELFYCILQQKTNPLRAF